MTYEILWTDEAFTAAQAFMVEDSAGLTGLFETVDDLARDPRPAAAFPWGSGGVLRLRAGRYRVLYEIDDTTVRIDVLHLGRGR
ncbi:type II toxin-antitoxin system RelE/ParE family toxin [Dermatophilaceae bacterium Soc4.6]